MHIYVQYYEKVVDKKLHLKLSSAHAHMYILQNAVPTVFSCALDITVLYFSRSDSNLNFFSQL